MSDDPRWLYRQMIDAMVVACAQGQGQISAQRVRVGLWNANAHEIADVDPNQEAMNALLAGLSEPQRATLAALFAEEFASGMFNALEVLHAAHLPPFESGYEGDPSDDFIGRMDGWEWPES